MRENANFNEIRILKNFSKIFAIYITTLEQDFNKKWDDSSHDFQEIDFVRIQMLCANKD